MEWLHGLGFKAYFTLTNLITLTNLVTYFTYLVTFFTYLVTFFTYLYQLSYLVYLPLPT